MPPRDESCLQVWGNVFFCIYSFRLHISLQFCHNNIHSCFSYLVAVRETLFISVNRHREHQLSLRPTSRFLTFECSGWDELRQSWRKQLRNWKLFEVSESSDRFPFDAATSVVCHIPPPHTGLGMPPILRICHSRNEERSHSHFFFSSLLFFSRVTENSHHTEMNPWCRSLVRPLWTWKRVRRTTLTFDSDTQLISTLCERKVLAGRDFELDK